LEGSNGDEDYGYGTPINGNTISALDEDNIAHDCFVWNNKGLADNTSWQMEYMVPYSTQGHVRFQGVGSNPLEPSLGGISWDMYTIVDISNLDRVTARANYNHSCYPAHYVAVNNYPIYSYRPERHDESYVFSCLALQLGKIIGQQQTATHVPCN
jgi:hypothetical protein